MDARRALRLLAGGAAVAGGTALYAWRASMRVELTHTVVPLAGLPPALDGLRILHVTDTHFPRNGASLPRFLDAVSRLEYDIVFATGDYAESSRGWPVVVEAFRRLDPKLGIYASLGGHDRWAGQRSPWDIWRRLSSLWGGTNRPRADPGPLVDALEQVGVTVLVNESTTIEVSGEVIRLIGIDDAYVGLADLDAAMQGAGEREPAGCRILLSHTPDGLLHPRAAEISLALCGHTHGGQIRLPFYGAPVRHAKSVDRMRTSGLMRIGQTPVYVSRGFGTAAVPLRLGCPPELGVVELRRAMPH